MKKNTYIVVKNSGYYALCKKMKGRKKVVPTGFCNTNKEHLEILAKVFKKNAIKVFTC